MAKRNTENLKPLNGRTPEEVKRITTMGGKASAAAQKRKRDLRAAAQAILEATYSDKNGEERTGAEMLVLKQFAKALNKGDTKAFEVLRDTAGQKPAQKVDVTTDVKNPLEGLTTEELKKLANGTNK